jgi:hypothetical protein
MENRAKINLNEKERMKRVKRELVHKILCCRHVNFLLFKLPRASRYVTTYQHEILFHFHLKWKSLLTHSMFGARRSGRRKGCKLRYFRVFSLASTSRPLFFLSNFNSDEKDDPLCYGEGRMEEEKSQLFFVPFQIV